MFEIDKCVRRPKFFANFLSGYYLSGPSYQGFKDQVRLTAKFEFCPALGKLVRTSVDFEGAERILRHSTILQRRGARVFVGADFITADM